MGSKEKRIDYYTAYSHNMVYKYTGTGKGMFSSDRQLNPAMRRWSISCMFKVVSWRDNCLSETWLSLPFIIFFVFFQVTKTFEWWVLSFIHFQKKKQAKSSCEKHSIVAFPLKFLIFAGLHEKVLINVEIYYLSTSFYILFPSSQTKKYLTLHPIVSSPDFSNKSVSCVTFLDASFTSDMK